MANGIDWFRWHHGSVRDEKFKLIARKTGASVPDVIAVWAYVLEKASANEVRGQFSDLDCEAVDCLYDFPEDRTAEIIAAMEKRGLLSPNHVTRWEDRQPQRERETPVPSTGRVQKFRANKLALQANETPCNTTKHPETPREEKSREEESRKQADDDSMGSIPCEPSSSSAEPEIDLPPADDFGVPPTAPLPMREQPPVSEDPAVILSVALRRQGVNCMSTHPALQEWAAKGVSIELLTEAVSLAREVKGNEAIPPNYLVPIIAKLLNPPAGAKSGTFPQARAGPPINEKFNFSHLDRSGDARAAAETIRKHNITIPEGDEEIEI